MRWALTILILLATLPASAGAQNLVANRLQSTLLRLQDTVSAAFARALPLPSASSGVSYSFDPLTGNFRRDATTLGQVYLDRADPLGKGRVNFSVSYAYVELDELDGKPADDLRDPAPIPLEGKAAAIALPRLRVNAAVHQVLLALTYGITDDLEASIALPLAYSDIDLFAEVRAAGVLAADGSLIRLHSTVNDPAHPFGPGDVLLRAKYRLLQTGPADVAAGLLLRIPTGEVKDLQGLGFYEVAPSLLASTRIFETAPWARLQGHGNVGVGFNADDVASSEVRWGLGLDWGLTERVTAAVAVLARHQLGRVAPAGAFTYNRCTAGLVACVTDRSVRHGSAPLFGLEPGRFDYYFLSLGGRGGLWRDTLFGFADVLLPLNDGFVRMEPIPIVGLEATF
jgi:hypothetical protein